MLDRLNTTEVFAGTTKLSSFEQEVFSRARAASEGLRRTFDAWIDIGKAVQIARRHADAGGGSPKVRNARFREILDEQQLGWLGARNRSTEVAQLLAIMSRLKEVQKWRASLPEHSRDR